MDSTTNNQVADNIKKLKQKIYDRSEKFLSYKEQFASPEKNIVIEKCLKVIMGEFDSMFQCRYDLQLGEDILYKKLILHIEDIDLTTRIRNALRNNGTYYVWQIVEKCDREFFKQRNFGRKSFKKLISTLEAMELHLQMDLSLFDLSDLPQPPH